MRLTRMQITNYRSFERLDLSFPSFYSAISGKNNAGKTNLVRAIRTLVPDVGPFSRPEEEVAYKDDYPHWKKKGADPVVLALTCNVDRIRDAGLHAFIARIGKLAENCGAIELTITRTVGPDSTDDITAVCVNGTSMDDFSSSEILKKLQTSHTILFYNSAELDLGHRFGYRRGFGGMLGEYSATDRESFEKIQKRVDTFLTALSKKHQKDIEGLLDKLEERYRVGLTLPKMNLQYMPIELSLGTKSFSVPLNDWGSGTRNRTQILLTILKAKKAAQALNLSDRITPVILIEEPESFLHPSAQAEFGRVLRDLSEELEVQVITTTHSPYMLSAERPEANVLLERSVAAGEQRESGIVDTSTDSWMRPFALALGLDNEEFTPWKKVLNSRANDLLLVEGETDIEYFELLRSAAHGDKALEISGDIAAYGGKDALKNPSLLRFILGKHERVFVTFDLDAQGEVERFLKMVGLESGKHYAPLGLNAPGKRDIEGLLPDAVTAKVYANNVALVTALRSADSKERNDARGKLKRLLLNEFQASATPGDADYGQFYKATAPVRKALRRSS